MNWLTIWHWFALAALLGIAEALIGANFLLLACAIAAFLVGVLSWIMPILSGEGQCLLFGIAIIINVVLWRKYLNKKSIPVNPSHQHLNQRPRQYINRYFTLEEPIVNGRGWVKVDDTIWRVEGEDLPANTRIQVVDVDGVVLKIKKV